MFQELSSLKEALSGEPGKTLGIHLLSKSWTVRYGFRHTHDMRWLVFSSLLFLNGCLGNSLGEVRATAPLQTRTYPALYEKLAACAKQGIETESWSFGEPTVHAARESATPLVSIATLYAGSALFEVTFQPVPSAMTLVKYRRGYDGYDSKEKTWAIIERCSQQVSAPSTPDTPLPPVSSASTTTSPTAP